MTNKSNADIVLEAIQDLHSREQVVTREVLAEQTGLTLSVVDDRVAHLIDNGHVHRVQRGVFVPVFAHAPARIVTRSLLPDGSSVLEIGEQVTVLTPREARMLGEVMAGAGQQFAAIELGRQAASVTGEISQRLKRFRRDFYELRSLVTGSKAAEKLIEGD